jgi:phage shock protein A
MSRLLNRLVANMMDDDPYWIGVDLDGTLAFYDEWHSDTHVGEPIPKMVARVQSWLHAGKKVKILTARAADMSDEARKAIEQWCYTHIGQVLPITCVKDRFMTELWDDKAVGVKENTGEVAMSKTLSKALARMTETAEASPSSIASAKAKVESVKGEIDTLKGKMDDLNTRISDTKSPEYVRQKTDMDKKMADLKEKLSSAQTALEGLQGK